MAAGMHSVEVLLAVQHFLISRGCFVFGKTCNLRYLLLEVALFCLFFLLGEGWGWVEERGSYTSGHQNTCCGNCCFSYSLSAHELFSSVCLGECWWYYLLLQPWWLHPTVRGSGEFTDFVLLSDNEGGGGVILWNTFLFRNQKLLDLLV